MIADAVALGLDCVEHGYQLTEQVTKEMAAQGTALVPTLLVTRCKSFFDELGVPEWMQARSLGAGARHVESYQMALQAGVEVLLGSDMPPFWRFDGTNATVRELEYMVEYGLRRRRRCTPAHSDRSAGSARRRTWGRWRPASTPT